MLNLISTFLTADSDGVNVLERGDLTPASVSTSTALLIAVFAAPTAVLFITFVATALGEGVKKSFGGRRWVSALLVLGIFGFGFGTVTALNRMDDEQDADNEYLVSLVQDWAESRDLKMGKADALAVIRATNSHKPHAVNVYFEDSELGLTKRPVVLGPDDELVLGEELAYIPLSEQGDIKGKSQ